MIKPLPISWFYENLPEEQLLEEKYKEIIKKNYNLSGFSPLDTPVVERLEALTSKWADDNEIYGLHRINGEQWDDASLGLRFDLTVPFARFVASHEGVLTFPFKRHHIARVYRWERPQKGRFREFYQADIDVVGNGKLPLFADVEVISTLYNALKELDFGNFVIHINNKKFLQGFLEYIWVEKIVETIWVIDKKDKVRKDILTSMMDNLWLDTQQKESIFEYIRIAEEYSHEDIFSYYSHIENDLLQQWLQELKYVYFWLKQLGVSDENLKINPAISRGLNYYTGSVFETFIVGAEKMWSISSWGRYENLASHFTKNTYPWVGGSIGLTRLLSILRELNRLEYVSKTTSQVVVVNMGDSFLKENLSIIKKLRLHGIACELYLDGEAKLNKQFKYANSKNIPYVIICWEDEMKSSQLQLKNLQTGEQTQLSLNDIIENLSA